MQRCPICNRLYPSFSIQAHANQCLDALDDQPTRPVPVPGPAVPSSSSYPLSASELFPDNVVQNDEDDDRDNAPDHDDEPMRTDPGKSSDDTDIVPPLISLPLSLPTLFSSPPSSPSSSSVSVPYRHPIRVPPKGMFVISKQNRRHHLCGGDGSMVYYSTDRYEIGIVLNTTPVHSLRYHNMNVPLQYIPGQPIAILQIAYLPLPLGIHNLLGAQSTLRQNYLSFHSTTIDEQHKLNLSSNVRIDYVPYGVRLPETKINENVEDAQKREKSTVAMNILSHIAILDPWQNTTSFPRYYPSTEENNGYPSSRTVNTIGCRHLKKPYQIIEYNGFFMQPLFLYSKASKVDKVNSLGSSSSSVADYTSSSTTTASSSDNRTILTDPSYRVYVAIPDACHSYDVLPIWIPRFDVTKIPYTINESSSAAIFARIMEGKALPFSTLSVLSVMGKVWITCDFQDSEGQMQLKTSKRVRTMNPVWNMDGCDCDNRNVLDTVSVYSPGDERNQGVNVILNAYRKSIRIESNERKSRKCKCQTTWFIPHMEPSARILVRLWYRSAGPGSLLRNPSVLGYATVALADILQQQQQLRNELYQNNNTDSSSSSSSSLVSTQISPVFNNPSMGHHHYHRTMVPSTAIPFVRPSSTASPLRRQPSSSSSYSPSQWLASLFSHDPTHPINEDRFSFDRYSIVQNYNIDIGNESTYRNWMSEVEDEYDPTFSLIELSSSNNRPIFPRGLPYLPVTGKDDTGFLSSSPATADANDEDEGDNDISNTGPTHSLLSSGYFGGIFASPHRIYFDPYQNFTLGDALLSSCNVNHQHFLQTTKGKYSKLYDCKYSRTMYDIYTDTTSALLTKYFRDEGAVNKTGYGASSSSTMPSLDRASGTRNLATVSSSSSSPNKTGSTMSQLLRHNAKTVNKEKDTKEHASNQPAYAPVLQHTVATLMADNVAENELFPLTDSSVKTAIPLVCPPGYRLGSTLNPLPYQKALSVHIPDSKYRKGNVFQTPLSLKRIDPIPQASEHLMESVCSPTGSVPYAFTTIPSLTPSANTNDSTFHLQVKDPLMVDGWVPLTMVPSSLFGSLGSTSNPSRPPEGIQERIVKNSSVWKTSPTTIRKTPPNDNIPAVRIQFRIVSSNDLVVPVGKGSERGLPIHWAAATGAHSLVDTIIRRMDSNVFLTSAIARTESNQTKDTVSPFVSSSDHLISTGSISTIPSLSTTVTASRSKDTNSVSKDAKIISKLVDIRRADGLSVLDLACVGISSDHARIVGRLESVSNSFRSLITSSVTVKPAGTGSGTMVEKTKDDADSALPTETSIPSRNTLHMAVLGGNRMIVTYVLQKCPNLLEQYDANGHTPIMLAAILGRQDLLCIMLGLMAGWISYASSPIPVMYRNLWNDVLARGPFPWIRKPGSRYIMNNQWRLGPLPSAYNYNADGLTSLHMACANARSSVVSLFLQLGTSPYAPVLQSVARNAGATSVNNGSSVALDYVLHLSDLVQLGDTPLHIAVRGACKYYLAIEYIRSIGKVTVPENYRRLCNDYQECVILLCSVQNGKFVQNANGDTPIHIIVNYGFADLLPIVLPSINTLPSKKDAKKRKETKQVAPLSTGTDTMVKPSTFLSWLMNRGSSSSKKADTVPINAQPSYATEETGYYQPVINGNGDTPLDLVQQCLEQVKNNGDDYSTEKQVFRERKLKLYENTRDTLYRLYGVPSPTVENDTVVTPPVSFTDEEQYDDDDCTVSPLNTGTDMDDTLETAEDNTTLLYSTGTLSSVPTDILFPTHSVLAHRSDSAIGTTESVLPPEPPTRSSSLNAVPLPTIRSITATSTSSVGSTVASESLTLRYEPSLLSRYATLINTPSVNDIMVYECATCTLRNPLVRAHEPGAYCSACHSFVSLRGIDMAWKKVSENVFGDTATSTVKPSSPLVSAGTGLTESDTSIITDVTEVNNDEDGEVSHTDFVQKLLSRCSTGYVSLSLNEVWKHRDLLIQATIEGATMAGITSSSLTRSRILQELEITEYSVGTTIRNLLTKENLSNTESSSALPASNTGATTAPTSSLLPPPAKTETCMACLEEVPLESFYQLSPCNHRYCKPCWKNYLAAVMDKGMDNLLAVPCMAGTTECSTLLTDADNENVWKLCCSPDLYSRYRRWMVQLYLRHQRNIQVCGNPVTCGNYLMRMDADDDILLSYLLHHEDDEDKITSSLLSLPSQRKPDEQIRSALDLLRSTDIRIAASFTDRRGRSPSPFARDHPLFDSYFNQLLSVHEHTIDVRCDCGYLTCLLCGGEGHHPVSCTDIDRWRDLVADMTDGASLRLMTDNYKKCPKCGVYTQKNGGCKHMTCVACKHQYCFNCRAVWTGYDHQCNKKASWKPMDAKEWNADALTKEERLAREGLPRTTLVNNVTNSLPTQERQVSVYRARQIERYMRTLTVQHYNLTVNKVGTQSTAQEIILQRIMSLTAPNLVPKIRDTLGPKSKYRYTVEEIEKLKKAKKEKEPNQSSSSVVCKLSTSYRENAIDSGSSFYSGNKRNDDYLAILPSRNSVFANEFMLMGKMYIETWKLFMSQLVFAYRSEPQELSNILYNYCVRIVGTTDAVAMSQSMWTSFTGYQEDGKYFNICTENRNSMISLAACVPAEDSVPVAASSVNNLLLPSSTVSDFEPSLTNLPAWYHLFTSRSLQASLRTLPSFKTPSIVSTSSTSSLMYKDFLAMALNMRTCTAVIGEHQLIHQPWFQCLTCAEECVYIQRRKNNRHDYLPSSYRSGASTPGGSTYPHYYDLDTNPFDDGMEEDTFITHTNPVHSCRGCQNLSANEMNAVVVTPDMEKWTKDCHVPLPLHIGVCASCALTCHRNHVVQYMGLRQQSCKCSKGYNGNLLPPTTEDISKLKALNVKENTSTILPIHLRATFGCVAYLPSILLFYNYKADSLLDSNGTNSSKCASPLLSSTVKNNGKETVSFSPTFSSTSMRHGIRTSVPPKAVDDDDESSSLDSLQSIPIESDETDDDDNDNDAIDKVVHRKEDTKDVVKNPLLDSIKFSSPPQSTDITMKSIVQIWDTLHRIDQGRKQRWKDEHRTGLEREQLRKPNAFGSSVSMIRTPSWSSLSTSSTPVVFRTISNTSTRSSPNYDSIPRSPFTVMKYRKECTVAMLTFLNASRILQWLYVHQMYRKLNETQRSLSKTTKRESLTLASMHRLSDSLLEEQIRALECRIDELFALTTNPVRPNLSSEVALDPYFSQRIRDSTVACQQLCRAIFYGIHEQRKREEIEDKAKLM